ncbi:peroxynitrite isomerase THAP4 isoform X2 [Nomia melanderi]|uniref:peroxynitrite isomerase THAP4 isoform X2 n=1 Tax=Nomia melanderi TaxID=2448451 RepID=UPI00130450CA|nr:THAP domain-containing protein 4-like isoform X2 [Nomia melanderi]
MNVKLPMHEALKPITWLYGQPMLNYTARSWYADSKQPIHYEMGFLRIIPDTNKVSLLLSHNRGIITIEEGVVEDEVIKLKTTSIQIPTKGAREPKVTKLQREFRLIGSCLQHTLCMATEATPELQEHLLATYVKDCDNVT